MKQIFTLLACGVLSLLSLSAKAQFSQNFDSGTSGLSGNCWTFNQVNWTNTPGQVITGTGSLYSLPPVSSSGNGDFSTPVLNISSTSLTVSFNYQLTSQLNGSATRTIQVGLLDVNNNFTLLATINLDKFTPLGVQVFSQTFNLTSTGLFKLDIGWAGDHGDGSSRLVFDDLYTNANARYGSGTCNSAAVAVNDIFSGLAGSTISGNVLTNDNEPDGETMTPSIVATSPDGVVVLNSNGSFTFTPNPGFTGSTTTFTYRLNDGGFSPLNSNTATVRINFFANSPLPIKLLNFDAKYNKPNVTLNWSTAMEKNFSHFVIEFSTDGNNFNQVATIFGAGESDSKKDYTYSDKNVADKGGLIYYRLKSVDIDGKSSYSLVRVIRLGEEKQGIVLTTYPNPVTNELRITIPTNWQNKRVTYEMFNSNGQLSKKTESANSSQTENLNVSSLAPGFYVVKVTCDGQSVQQKIVKQ
jgi:Bacterial Ig domain/Secretion system C-terminal sorting domain